MPDSKQFVTEEFDGIEDVFRIDEDILNNFGSDGNPNPDEKNSSHEGGGSEEENPLDNPNPDDVENYEDDPEYQERLNYVNNHFSYLKKQGLILVPDDYEFDGNIEQAYIADAQERQRLAEETLLGSLPQKAKDIVKYAISVDDESFDLSQIMELTGQENSLDYSFGEDEAKAEQFVLDYYQNTLNLPPSAAKAAVENHKDDKELLKFANTYKEKMLEEVKAQKQQIIEQQASDKKNKQEKQINHLNAVNSEIKNSQFDMITKQNLQAELYEGKASDKIYHLFNNDPKGLVTLLSLLSQYDKEKGFAFNTIDKKAKQRAAKQLNENFHAALATTKTTSAKGRRSSNKQKLPEDYTYIEFK